ncbi:uncharacterized protein LOC122506364 [Leptopilina heterotoma]|uniref:uncharacterized protein LOC122506364 n=1 Tax=Leptopilina heterotoma TaxID=63436 RepID=UPI001CA848D4|nr:uncharacterized protein LOC122506364 [Leptopilina heterotoma]
MIKSLSVGTLNQYEKPLRLWWDFCLRKKIQIFDAKATEIIMFLTEILDNINTYGTLNSYRSAISLIRMSEVGSDPSMKRFFKDKIIQIKIPGRIKSSGVNKSQPGLKLPFFREERELCVASTLSEYIKRTEPIRGNVEELFITFKNPKKAASTPTLSRWIKCILTESGIDTSFFKSYSTRHASSSAAKRQGVLTVLTTLY